MKGTRRTSSVETGINWASWPADDLWDHHHDPSIHTLHHTESKADFSSSLFPLHLDDHMLPPTQEP